MLIIFIDIKVIFSSSIFEYILKLLNPMSLLKLNETIQEGSQVMENKPIYVVLFLLFEIKTLTTHLYLFT